jgi:Cu-Zn family superoxide dismutase
MPNFHVPSSGEVTLEIFNAQLTLSDDLLDDDGAAIVVHAGADDYRSDPAGDAGDRIACGVIKGGP